MASKDFDGEIPGRRVRVSMAIYQASNRQFRHVKGVGARVTVRNAGEQKRLWKCIEDAIAKGDWRDHAHSLSDAVAAPAGS